MTTTTNTNTLRAAIETAMRRRDPCVRVSVTPAAGQTLASVDGPSSALVWGSSMADTTDEALRRLARGFGLRDDGSDPAAEVERMTTEVATLTRERDEAYAALRACARRCEHRCGEIATIRAGDDTQQGGAFRYCDNPACRGYETVLGDLPHAAALRAAGGGR